MDFRCDFSIPVEVVFDIQNLALPLLNPQAVPVQLNIDLIQKIKSDKLYKKV